MLRWWLAVRWWASRTAQAVAEWLRPTPAIAAPWLVTVEVGEPWTGPGPMHEVWTSSNGRSRSFQSGAAATAFYQQIVDARDPQRAEFRTDGVTRSRYDGGD